MLCIPNLHLGTGGEGLQSRSQARTQVDIRKSVNIYSHNKYAQAYVRHSQREIERRYEYKFVV